MLPSLSCCFSFDFLLLSLLGSLLRTSVPMHLPIFMLMNYYGSASCCS